VAALLYGGGWTCLIFAAAQHRRSRDLLGLGKETLSVFLKANSRFIAAVTVLILLAYVAVVLFPADRVEFATATRDELTQKIEGDFAMLPVYLRGLDDAAAAIEKDKRLLEGDPSKLSPEDKALLLQLWSTYLAYSLQLEQIKHVHKHFYQINYLQFPDLNLTSFLIAYSAFAGSFADALKLAALVGDNDYLKTLLNEAHDDCDVPRDAYLSLARAVTDPNNLIRLNAGQAHLQFLKAAGKLALPAARCAVIEDAPAGVQAALRAGMTAIAVTGTADRDKLARADLVVDSMTELTPRLIADLIDHTQRP
jgi:hypothetical protein